MNPLIRGCFFLGSTALTLAKGVILNQASAAEATSLGLVGVLTTRHTLAQAMRYRRDPDPQLGARVQFFLRNAETSDLGVAPVFGLDSEIPRPNAGGSPDE